MREVNINLRYIYILTTITVEFRLSERLLSETPIIRTRL